MNLKLFYMDIKMDCLNGDLVEVIYMEQSEEFIKENQKDKVYRLKRSLYSLKQSSHQWYLTFH